MGERCQKGCEALGLRSPGLLIDQTWTNQQPEIGIRGIAGTRLRLGGFLEGCNSNHLTLVEAASLRVPDRPQPLDKELEATDSETGPPPSPGRHGHTVSFSRGRKSSVCEDCFPAEREGEAGRRSPITESG